MSLCRCKGAYRFSNNTITLTIPFDKTGFNQDGTVNEGGLSKYEKLIMDVLSWNGSLEFEVQNEPQKGELQENIIKLIKDNPKITRKEMSIKLGKSINTIFRILKDNPYIKYVGSSKKWSLGNRRKR